MLEKKTVIDQVEITRDGTIQVRFALVVLEDGEEISGAWHRTSIPPGTDVAEQMATVNEHLRQMKKSSIEDVSLLERLVPVVHTKEVKAAYTAKQKAAETLMEGKLR